MMPTNNETEEFVLYKRKENNKMEWEEVPTLKFLGRTASTYEKNHYRITQGTVGNSDSLQLFVTNLPAELKPFDKILFRGKLWTIQNIGYYYDNNRIVNRRIMSDEYISQRSPKGLSIV